MTSITLKTVSGKDAGSLELDADVFGVQPNVPVMHQVVTAQLAARRSGTQSTKTRAEVSGGGKKPFKQKGTGNARQGSTRSPHFSGGGVALGPKPRKYDQKTPKKMIKLALRSALSDRAADGKVVVVDEWGWETPKTKNAVAALAALGVDGKALVVVDTNDVTAIRSFLNLPQVQLIEVAELNAYDVLCNDYVVFTKATLPSGTPIGGTRTAPATADDEGPFGLGSHGPTESGEAPEGFDIKGNAQSMLYHIPGSRYYDATIAEAWFATEDAAKAAGFSKAGSRAKKSDDGDAAGEEESE
ncbi:MAG TPA: 50S ribosomal protein L4 [Acidimicrobiaceae bacterium]|nr:50S ribosomal protein L4 [Acidimicrobiaceae bacterium]